MCEPNENNASEHTLNDCWNDGREVLFSEEWNGTTRFQRLRMQLPEGNKWVNGRPTQVQKTTRLDTIGSEEWHRLLKKQKKEEIATWDEEKTRLQHACRKRGNIDVSSEDTEHLKVISEGRVKLEKCVDPFDAVHSQR